MWVLLKNERIALIFYFRILNMEYFFTFNDVWCVFLLQLTHQ